MATMRRIQTLFCAKDDAIDGLEKVCKVLPLSDFTVVPKYIVAKSFSNYYIFVHFRSRPLNDNTDNVLEY